MSKKAKPVILTNKYGVDTKYPSAKCASVITGVDQGSISSCCRNERKSAGGYKWRLA